MANLLSSIKLRATYETSEAVPGNVCEGVSQRKWIARVLI